MLYRIMVHLYLLNSAICFCENKTKTEDGAFLALLEPEPRVDPLCDSDAGVAAEAGVSAAVSTADSAAEPSSFAFFFLIFFSLSAYKLTLGNMN